MKKQTGFGFALATTAATGGATGGISSIGSLIPGVGTVIGIFSGGIGSIVSGIKKLWTGRTPEESYREDIVPIIQPFVQMTGMPVAVFHYEWLWILQPNGNVISPTGPEPVAEGANSGYELLQQYCNATGQNAAALQFLTSYMDGKWWYQLFKPQYELIEPDFSGESFASSIETKPQGLNILQAGFGSNPIVLISLALLALTFTLGKKKKTGKENGLHS